MDKKKIIDRVNFLFCKRIITRVGNIQTTRKVAGEIPMAIIKTGIAKENISNKNGLKHLLNINRVNTPGKALCPGSFIGKTIEVSIAMLSPKKNN